MGLRNLQGMVGTELIKQGTELMKQETGLINEGTGLMKEGTDHCAQHRLPLLGFGFGF